MKFLTAEDQELGGWKVASDQGESLTKNGLVKAIKRSGRKMDIRRLGTGWVGASERLERNSDRGVSLWERVIREQGIRE